MTDTKLLVVAVLAVGTAVLAGAANANERDVTCRGKLVDTSESSFQVGECDFVRNSHGAVLATCSKYSKNGRFLGNLYCVGEARVDDDNHCFRARTL